MNASASTAWQHWTSPSEVLERLYTMGPIALDPASNPTSIVVAAQTYMGPDVDGKDGLFLPWAHDGLNYVNCPYGRALAPWTKKMADEAKLGAEIVALLPAATGPKWFHENVSTAALILFWRGRLRFGNPPPSGASSSTFDNMLCYWGKRRLAFIAAFEGCGLFVVPSYGRGNQ